MKKTIANRQLFNNDWKGNRKNPSHKTNLLIVLLGLLFIQSCDPARIMVIKTFDNKNYSVTVYANKNILPQFYFYPQDSSVKKVVIQVPTSDTVPQSQKVFLNGTGVWSDNYIMRNFSKNIDSIIIVDSKGILTLNSPSSINNFLLENRHGFANHKLIIEAK